LTLRRRPLRRRAGSLLVVVPPEVPLVADEWHDGLVRACRRFLDRELRFTRLGD
jgi:hypothetical protein